VAQPLYAIMLDGGFLTKKLYERLSRHPTADDIVAECDTRMKLPQVAGYELLRIYYYDAHPSTDRVKRPVSRSDLQLGATPRYRQSQSLFDQLDLRPHFALRMGQVTLSPTKWRIRPRVMKDLLKAPRALTDADFDLDMSQKGVDMHVGMDMARLALKELARTVIVVTGDSDFVPAFKFVRREGVKVILATLGHNVRTELRQHADIVI